MTDFLSSLGPWGPVVSSALFGGAAILWLRREIESQVVKAFNGAVGPVLIALGDHEKRIQALESEVTGLKARGQAQRRGDL